MESVSIEALQEQHAAELHSVRAASAAAAEQDRIAAEAFDALRPMLAPIPLSPEDDELARRGYVVPEGREQARLALQHGRGMEFVIAAPSGTPALPRPGSPEFQSRLEALGSIVVARVDAVPQGMEAVAPLAAVRAHALAEERRRNTVALAREELRARHGEGTHPLQTGPDALSAGRDATGVRFVPGRDGERPLLVERPLTERQLQKIRDEQADAVLEGFTREDRNAAKRLMHEAGDDAVFVAASVVIRPGPDGEPFAWYHLRKFDPSTEEGSRYPSAETHGPGARSINLRQLRDLIDYRVRAVALGYNPDAAQPSPFRRS